MAFASVLSLQCASAGRALGADTHASEAARAEALFAEGRKLMAAGNYAAACPKLADSQALDPAPGTALNVAFCYEGAGQLASAWAAYKTAQALAENTGQKNRAAAARSKASQLEPKLSRMVIAVPPASRAAGLDIKCDGDAVKAPEWGVAIPRDGGEHRVDATAPGKKPWSTRVTLGPSGQTIQVDVPELEDEPAPAPVATSQEVPEAAHPAPPAFADEPHAAASPGRNQRIAAVVVGGAGIVGMGVGGTLGLVAKSHDDTAAGESGIARHQDSLSAVSQGTVATVVVCVGAAVAVTGVVLWLTAPRAPVAVGASGSQLLLRGTF